MANCEESPREKHSFNNEEFRKLNKEEIERLRYFLVLWINNQVCVLWHKQVSFLFVILLRALDLFFIGSWFINLGDIDHMTYSSLNTTKFDLNQFSNNNELESFC